MTSVKDGYENLALKRDSTENSGTPYAQLGVGEYEELPDSKPEASSPATAFDAYENLADNSDVVRNDVTSTFAELDPYEDIAERRSHTAEPPYDNIHAAALS